MERDHDLREEGAENARGSPAGAGSACSLGPAAPTGHTGCCEAGTVFQAGEGLPGTGWPVLRVGQLQGIHRATPGEQGEMRVCGLRARARPGLQRCCDHRPRRPDFHADRRDVQGHGLHTSARPPPVAEPATDNAER